AWPGGGIMVRWGGGHEGVDKARCAAAGIHVANTPGILESAVAEHALWLLGSLAKGVVRQHREMAGGQWTGREGIELRGRKLLVVGCGRIGRELARKAALGFGMVVTGCGRLGLKSLLEREGVSFEDFSASTGLSDYTNALQDALPRADAVVICAAATAATRHLVSEDFLAQMKPGALLVNVSRGSLVDEKALFDSLAGGHLGGAGLDVFECEPYAPVDRDHDLRGLVNVVLTPHSASHTEESNDGIARMAAQTVITALTQGVEGLGNLVGG
ncbi:MAG: NAD(P)-dependent oxidoreductase, partial [Verrucomicrobiales bacterium]